MKRSTLVGLIVAGAAVLLLLSVLTYSKVIKPVISLRSSIVLQGPSMEPTYKEGDLLRTKAVTPDALRRGDVVAVRDPIKPDRTLVKRIIAVGGDQVEVRKGGVYLNGNLLDEQYASRVQTGDMASITVPVGSLFLLGDNRGASFDSRHFGTVPADSVKSIVIADN